MEHKSISGKDFYNMVVNASNRLIEQSDFVNALNVFPVPDGDTGTNMSMTFKAAVKEIENINTKSIGEVSKKLAKGALMGARGNSGVILSQILRGFSKGLDGLNEATTEDIKRAFVEGQKSAYKAVMRPTEGTILSVIRYAAEEGNKSQKEDVTELMEEITVKAKEMLDKTPELLPALKKAKVVDSGGMGLYIILASMTEALEKGIVATINDKDIAPGSLKAAKSGTGASSEADIKFGYCTEFIILGDASAANDFKSSIENLGDCTIVVGYEDVIKVHIHTNDPGLVLSKAVKLGELSKIKIDNMREEHREILELQGADNLAAVENNDEETETKKYGFITVAMGSGIKNIFTDLGVDYVIEGGQTMNPSTQDILDCINKVNAENIFVLPNNKNIIMAAKQAAEITEKNAIVIETTTIPQGITCITSFNPNAELEENKEQLMNAISTVKTGSVTYAVRDTEMDGIEIKEGNMLGLLEGKIKEVGMNKFEVCEKILQQMVDEDSELITILYGKDVEENDIKPFIEKLEDEYEDLDIQCYSGNQPLYYFFVSVE